MKKIIVVGNSHAAVLANMWDHSGSKIGIAEVDPTIYVSWIIPWGAWSVGEETLGRVYELVRDILDEETTILFFLGSPDIRNNLVKHNNTEEVVEFYVKSIEKYFSKFPVKVGFIDPLPVTDDPEFLNNDDYLRSFGGTGSPEEKFTHYALFKKKLREISNIHVSIDEVLLNERLTKNESDDGCHLKMSKNYQILEILRKKFLD